MGKEVVATRHMRRQTFGTVEEGFELGIGDDAQALHIRMWGFWTLETASRFSGVVIGACASARVSTVTIDAAELKPLRDVGQDAFGGMLAALPAYKVQRVLLTAAGPLTRLQLLRIAKERSQGNLVQYVS
jgi:hypothetical protein